MHVAIYARTSTADQHCENQLHELRRYVAARDWTATEYVDHGVSGARERRPALDRMMTDALQRRVEAIIVWRLDRFGRSLAGVVTAIRELDSAGVKFISLGENVDTGSPTGRLVLGIMASLSEWERERIRERIHAGLARARREGKRLGRRRERITERDLKKVAALSVRQAAAVLRVPASRVHNERQRVFGKPPRTATLKASAKRAGFGTVRRVLE